MKAELSETVGRFVLRLRVEEEDGEFKLDHISLYLDSGLESQIHLLTAPVENFEAELDALKVKASELVLRAKQIRDLLNGSDIFYVEDAE